MIDLGIDIFKLDIGNAHDHQLPAWLAMNPNDQLQTTYDSYASSTTTISGEENKRYQEYCVHPRWRGDQDQYPKTKSQHFELDSYDAGGGPNVFPSTRLIPVSVR